MLLYILIGFIFGWLLRLSWMVSIIDNRSWCTREDVEKLLAEHEKKHLRAP